MKIILATNNPHKVEEAKAILGNDIEIITPAELNINLNVEETGKTFLENAILKAKTAFEFAKIPAIADDSGLEVEVLNNRPGIYSSRYAGENATDKDNIKKLLEELKGIPFEKRKARFVCTTVFYTGNNEISFAEGIVEGFIAEKPEGNNGFGYDPVFYYPELKKTFAQLSSNEKNKISHRRKSLQALKYKIIKYKENKQN